MFSIQYVYLSDDIAKMSLDDFKKRVNLYDRQYFKGLIEYLLSSSTDLKALALINDDI